MQQSLQHGALFLHAYKGTDVIAKNKCRCNANHVFLSKCFSTVDRTQRCPGARRVTSASLPGSLSSHMVCPQPLMVCHHCCVSKRGLCHLQEHLGVDGLRDALDLSADGQVNLAGAVLHDKASNQGLVNDRLELDVLGASQLLDLLSNKELLLLLQLDSGAEDSDLMRSPKRMHTHISR